MMPDYAYADDVELHKLNDIVNSDPDVFEHWEKLIRAAEAQEGGLTRNSSPQAITALRDAYDRFLARYPLFFGYWKKYADLEFAIAGTEAAEMVYERAVACIPVSVDLWTLYCAFKVETSHDNDVIRELFDRGADSVGLDFLAHPFWDRYLEFEERAEQPDHIFKILERVIQIPQHQYARYFDRFRTMALSRPIDELAPADVIAQIQTELATDSAHTEKGAAEVERDLRAGIDAHHLKLFQRTQIETTKRWTYEAEIKRPYYHVLDLDEAQISNWQMYLDYEEAEGDYNRVKFLYERCLVTCANYDDFWSRYVRWTLSQQDKPQQIRDEEARNIYARACCFYVPIARHSIRLSYARFEESLGKADMAIAIHEAILMQMPGHLETIISLANTHRRQNGVDAAVDTLTTYAGSIEDDINTRGALVAELARLTWKIKGDVGAARKIFQDQQRWFPDSVKFWGDFFDFELAQPTSAADEATRSQSIRAVFNDIRYKSQLPPEMIKSLAMKYFDYLLERGDKAAVEEYVNLDREINGPASVAAKQPDPAPVATEMKDMVVDHPMGLENGDAPP